MGVEDQDSISPDESTLDTDGQVDAPVDADAESSAASDEGETPSLLDVVRNAAPDEEEGDEPDSPAGSDEPDDADPKEEGEASEDQPSEPDDENFTDVPFHKHPRFQRLVQQRNEYRQGHEQFQSVQTYLQENGLSADEAASALRLQALMKRDPNAAWAELKPIVQKILVDTGEVLPQDLRQQVQQGKLTQAHALELSRARASQAGQQERQQHEAQLRERNQQTQAVRDMQTSAATWEQGMRAKDPEFDAKSEALQKEVLWQQRQNGMPKDAAGVRKMLDDAYAAVARASAPRERRPAKTPLTGGRAAGANDQPAPKSVLEIVQRGG